MLKKTLQTVTGTVNSINSEEVDWTTIFTRSVSPAVIAGVASMFAFAIGNAVNFQSAMLQAGTAAGATAGQIGQISDASLGLSTQVPASAQDLANAMLQLSAIFPGINDQQQVAAAMAELSASGFGNLNDIVSSSTDIFKQFGVTTGDQAVTVLTDLMHAAEAAKESIPALASQFAPFSEQLPVVDKNVNTFNGLISTFGSEVKNLGSAGAQQIFQALAASSNTAVGPMELLGTSFSSIQKSLLTDGGLSAIQRTSETLLKMGPGASLVATNFGLSATQVGEFQTNAKKFPQIAIDTMDIAHNTQSIGDAYKQSDSDLRTLQETWNGFLTFSIHAGAFIIDGIKGWGIAFRDVIGVLDSLSNKLTSSILPVFKELNKVSSSIVNSLTPLATPDYVAKGTSTSLSTDASLLNVGGAGNNIVSSLDSLNLTLQQLLNSPRSSGNPNLATPPPSSTNSGSTNLYNLFNGIH